MPLFKRDPPHEVTGPVTGADVTGATVTEGSRTRYVAGEFSHTPDPSCTTKELNPAASACAVSRIASFSNRLALLSHSKQVIKPR